MIEFTKFLEKLGSNFLVSSMVPSLALVVASILMFDPILKIATTFENPKSPYQLISFGVMVFIFTVIIGFTLTALNTFILKMFEGYFIFPPIRFLYNKVQKIHQEKARSLQRHRDKLKSHIRRLEGLNKHETERQPELDEFKDRYYAAAASYDLTYPEALADVLPTQFGNTLKAAENYSGDRYGFDGVSFWPRLVYVIPNDYKLTIDSVRNELSFLVNMSVLSIIFSLFCVFAIFYSMWTFDVGNFGPVAFFTFFMQAFQYLLAAAIGMISCGLFYKASILSVGSFGLMIRSSVDLFRMDLLKRLEVERPRDSREEFMAWQTLSDRIVLGRQRLVRKKNLLPEGKIPICQHWKRIVDRRL